MKTPMSSMILNIVLSAIKKNAGNNVSGASLKLYDT